MHHLALGQVVPHEHRVDGLQVEFGGQVHHREILVVEIAMLLRRIAVALDEMAEQFLMRRDVAVEVHRHEAGELQKARIDVAHEARMRERHLDDALRRNQSMPRCLGELVDRGRVSRVSIGPPISVIEPGT